MSDVESKTVNPDGPTLELIRAKAQAEADRSGVDIAIGWQVNDTTGEKEYGYCPAHVAPNSAFVVEVLETVKPYRGGRADYSERQGRRYDRLRAAARRASRESDRRFTVARGAIAGIPPGQPILIGHHSERHHRAALRRHDRNMRASLDARRRAAELDARASSVGDGGISSDDPQALEKLRARLAEMDRRQSVMKTANQIIRRHKADPDACVRELLSALPGLLSDRAARELLKPDFCGRIGFADYSLKNNNANMRRVRQRIDELERRTATAEGEQARSRGEVVYQIANNRVQLIFPSKPSGQIRARLKAVGFRWAPSEGAWQRHLNEAAKYHAREFITWLNQINTQEG